MKLAKQKIRIDRVDERDQIIGTTLRRHALIEPINFRVAHLFLFDWVGNLLVQKIATGNRHEGMWGSSAATYVRSGEDYRRAISRSLGDELGVEKLRIKAVGTTAMNDGLSQKFIALFVGRLPRHRALTLNTDEIDGVEFVSIPNLKTQIKAKRRLCTPTFLQVLEFYERSKL